MQDSVLPSGRGGEVSPHISLPHFLLLTTAKPPFSVRSVVSPHMQCCQKERAALRPFIGLQPVVRLLVSCAEDMLKYTYAGETLSLIKLRLHKGARLYGDVEDASAGRATFCFSP